MSQTASIGRIGRGVLDFVRKIGFVLRAARALPCPRALPSCSVALPALFLLLSAVGPALAAEEVETLAIAYLTQLQDRPPALSGLDEPPEDEGIQGGRLAIVDNTTTGRFTKQNFEFFEVVVPVGGDVMAAFPLLDSTETGATDGVGFSLDAGPAPVLTGC